MQTAIGGSLVPVRYVLPRGWAHLLDSAVLGVVGEVRRSPGPLLFAGSSSLQAPWRAAYLGGGGSRSQGCHGYLLAMPEAFRLPPNL